MKKRKPITKEQLEKFIKECEVFLDDNYDADSGLYTRVSVLDNNKKK